MWDSGKPAIGEISSCWDAGMLWNAGHRDANDWMDFNFLGRRVALLRDIRVETHKHDRTHGVRCEDTKIEMGGTEKSLKM